MPNNAWKAAGCALVLCLCLGSPQNWGSPVTVESGVSLVLAEKRAARISDIHYQLALDIPAEMEAPIMGELAIEFDLSNPAIPLQLDFQQTEDHLISVTGENGAINYRFEQEHLVIPAAALKSGRNRLQIEFIAGDGSLNRNPDFLYTLFVPDRARTAFPLFDQPDLKASYTLSLSIPAAWEAIANAPLAQKHTKDDKTLHQFAPSELTSSYLVSFVAGKFQRVTREINGRSISLLHRETDEAKVKRNLDTIFQLHAASLDWMETYTGIPYPFAKFDLALIPSFQYGGMEHPGAIQYRASSLLLDESPSETQLLNRASLIAHETAHMWFGNLVTMKWFNDVWTKEVFANFMAAKIVGPSFPEVNHQLNFLVDHYPGAYRVDRSNGANPIRQHLSNLNLAGQMYGPIIYLKAPIMMRQLELVVGEEAFRLGMQKYLQRFAFANATWPDLIAILDPLTTTDLQSWSEVWVNTPGMPHFQVEQASGGLQFVQHDPTGKGRIWPQQFSVNPGTESVVIESGNVPTPLASAPLQLNDNGFGYGLFPTTGIPLEKLPSLPELARGALLVDSWENFLHRTHLEPAAYTQQLLTLIPDEPNQLVLELMLGQLYRLHASFLIATQRQAMQVELENMLITALEDTEEPGRARLFADALAEMARSKKGLNYLRKLWDGSVSLDTLPLSETNRIKMAQLLALGMPAEAANILASQRKQIANPDNLRRFDFVLPSLSADKAVRDNFFTGLAAVDRRATESWVLEALGYLHHPNRVAQSQHYVLPSLELLEEIQVTGDIFFPAGWVNQTLANHHSPSVVETVNNFLEQRPDYNPQLRMKILQAVDMAARASRYH